MYEFFKNNPEGNYIRVTLDNKKLLKEHFNSKGYHEFNTLSSVPEHEELIMYFDETNSYVFCKEHDYKEAIKIWTEYSAEQFIDANYILKEKVKTLEPKLRELFDNENNVIVCDSKEDKLLLFELLDKLNYKTASNISYKNNNIALYGSLESYIRPGGGIHGNISSIDKNYKIINFKNILKEIDLEDLKQLKL